MANNKPRQIAVTGATLLLLLVNILADALPLNGQTGAEIAARFSDQLTPAGWVFSIRIVVFAALIAFTAFHSLTSSSWYPRMQKVGWWYVAACLLNCAWVIGWHYELFTLSLAALAALLVTLVVIYVLLDISAVTPKPLERWTVDIPFSIYLGWISFLTFVSATDVLVYRGFDGGRFAPLWALAMLTVAGGIAVLMFLIRTDVAFLLVFAWSFAGIALQSGAAPLVAAAAWITAGLSAALAAASAAWRIRTKA